jgi:hypothetical protein
VLHEPPEERLRDIGTALRNVVSLTRLVLTTLALKNAVFMDVKLINV